MTDNEKLARWQGKKCICGENKYHEDYCYFYICADYPNDDAAAMSLLDTLVEKGLLVMLRVTNDNLRLWRVVIYDIYDKYCDTQLVEIKGKPTRREAVVAACLELIEKEAEKANSMAGKCPSEMCKETGFCTANAIKKLEVD